MKTHVTPFFIFFLVSFQIGTTQLPDNSDFVFQHELSRPLREISGVFREGRNLWAIVDGPGSKLYKIDTSGNIVQEISLSNARTTDVESVTADEDYVYMGDTGNNHGNRKTLSIYKIKKALISNDPKTAVNVEVISFQYPEADAGKRKRSNNYDAESLISVKDSLFIFTKRRGDHQTELISIPKIPGSYVARSVDIFNCDGLITDAAINKEGNEVVLLGYLNGHFYPFVWLFNNFHGTNFFSGSHRQYQLTTKEMDWQTEGICYLTDHLWALSCEQTSDQRASLYGLKRDFVVN